MPSDDSDAFVCACAGARQVARLLTQLYDERLKPSGTETPQLSLLMALEKAGTQCEGDIGRRFGLDKTTVSRNLRLLERKGWIESTVGSDKRKRNFRLTAVGRERLAAARPEWKKVQHQLRARLGAVQWDALFAAYRKVNESVRELQSAE